MVTVKFHAYPDGRMELRVTGHAHFAPRGQDVICAAVSILTYTAAASMQEAHRKGKLQSEPRIFLKEGYAVISARPRVVHRSAVRGIFRTVRCGMAVLARNFPDHVRLSGRV